MISRYALSDIAAISKRFNIIQGLPKGVKPNYNISPTITAPVILSENGALVVKQMKWGLLSKGAKDTNSVFRYKTYNVPSETVLSKHSWDIAIRESRCIVPANGFYDLGSNGKKQAYYAKAKDGRLLGFAGIYSSWQDPEGVTHGTYSVITTGATDDMPLSTNRMPKIIMPEDEARWLDPTVTDISSIYDMLRSNPVDLVDAYEVGPAVHSPKASQASLIDRI